MKDWTKIYTPFGEILINKINGKWLVDSANSHFVNTKAFIEFIKMLHNITLENYIIEILKDGRGCCLFHNSEDLQDKLETFGYDILKEVECSKYIAVSKDMVEGFNNEDQLIFKNVVNCGNNEEMFLTLAKLQYNTLHLC